MLDLQVSKVVLSEQFIPAYEFSGVMIEQSSRWPVYNVSERPALLHCPRRMGIQMALGDEERGSFYNLVVAETTSVRMDVLKVASIRTHDDKGRRTSACVPTTGSRSDHKQTIATRVYSHPRESGSSVTKSGSADVCPCGLRRIRACFPRRHRLL